MDSDEGIAWATVAERMNAANVGTKRSGKQCRERWRNHLNPDIRKYTLVMQLIVYPRRDPWTEEEDVQLLQAQQECGNKWSEIAKRLEGRCENSVKNRYNMLYKKYGVDLKKTGVADVSSALHAVSEGKKGNSDWAQRLVEEKKKKIAGILYAKKGLCIEQKKDVEVPPEKLQITSTAMSDSNATAVPPAGSATVPAKAPAMKSSAPPKGLSGLKTSLMEATRSEIIENQSQFTCPNYRYINRMMQRNSEITSKAEKFVNPVTQQELFFSDQGIFVYNDQGCKLLALAYPRLSSCSSCGHGSDQTQRQTRRIHYACNSYAY